MDCLNSSLSSRVSRAWNSLADAALASLSLSQKDLAPLAAVRSFPPKYQTAAKNADSEALSPEISTEKVWGEPLYLHYQQPCCQYY